MSASTSRSSSFSRALGLASILLFLLASAYPVSAGGFEERLVDRIIRPSRAPALEVVYYDVRGATISELRKSLDANGPADHDGTKRDAYFSWWMSWSWPEGRLRPVVESRYRLVLPRLSNAASESVRGEWERFFHALLTHELVHLENALRNENLLRESLTRSAAENPSFDFSRLNSVGHSILAKLREEDKRFDQSTDNGRSEGVRLRE